MIAIDDPQRMTTEERFCEVAAILACGILRRIRTEESATSSTPKKSLKDPKSALIFRQK